MKNILWVVTFLGFIFIMEACQDVASYPVEPQISLKSFQFVDTVDTFSHNVRVKLMTVVLNFTDGDGDLFSQYKDTISLRSKIHLRFYKKENGIYTMVPDSFLKMPYNFNLPYSSVMDRNGQNKTQKGTIEFSNYFIPGFPIDTAQVECSIMDQANHESNLLRIPIDLVFK
jgi:hypothetical protein